MFPDDYNTVPPKVPLFPTCFFLVHFFCFASSDNKVLLAIMHERMWMPPSHCISYMRAALAPTA